MDQGQVKENQQMQGIYSSEPSHKMINLVFTGIAIEDPAMHTTGSGKTIATFPVEVKEQPHLPPTKILVVAIGKQAVYAQQVIKKNSLVMVDGWFYVERNKKG